MRKFILGILVGALIFSVNRIDASNLLEVVQFPAKLIINGSPAALDADHPMLNYNGSAYVPVRIIGEALQSKVKYLDDPERTISINDPRAKLPQNYPEDLAILNGDVVYLSMSKAYNEVQISDFLNNIQKNVGDWIRITRYTFEGDPIIQLVSYNDGIFRYTLDNSRDKFGATDIRVMDCSELNKSNGELLGHKYTELTLKGCGQNQESTSLYKLFDK
ncbi:DUF4362 domain-containing protein [Paenibacillus ginsengarvi]|uniref:DUF4362 domain-containing protein n=1 Tax=Paenibacillus ginsengarvi TaxID=400777 RepID=A0A3B0AW26_9BACL|nr:DUF4362 domain-containing protein [Paenibacillus ginsengarvi]RKN64580.1 DUF4362 domain-containing protein [Paenibacillus ginsengarvi]